MVVAAAQRMQVSRRVDDDLATHEPRDPFGNGRFEGQQVSLVIGFSVAWYVSLPADGYGIVKNDMVNVMQSMPNSFGWPTPGPARPEQFFKS